MNEPNKIEASLREEYNPDAGTYHVYNVWDHPQPLTKTVIQALATVTGTRCEDVGRMYEVVDPDALNAVFDSVSDEVPRASGGVSFPLSGRTVTVYGHGELVVTVKKPTRSGVLDPSDSG